MIGQGRKTNFLHLGKYPPKKLLRIVVIVALVVAVGAVYWSYRHNQASIKQPSSGATQKATKLSPKKSIAIDAASTNQALAKKDYATAAQTCESMATTQYYDNQISTAEKTLKDCIKKLPTDQVPWSIYRSLGYVDKELKKNEAATQYFKTAIDKYQRLSDKKQDILDQMQQALKEVSS